MNDKINSFVENFGSYMKSSVWPAILFSHAYYISLQVGNNQNAKSGICQVENYEDNLNGSNELQVDDSSEMPGGVVNNAESTSVACTEKDSLDDMSVTNDSRPLKKMKCPLDESCCATETSNG